MHLRVFLFRLCTHLKFQLLNCLIIAGLVGPISVPSKARDNLRKKYFFSALRFYNLVRRKLLPVHSQAGSLPPRRMWRRTFALSVHSSICCAMED